jgi:hypothetical protein
MKTFGKLGITLCCAAALSYGATWNGKLMDASCYDSHKGARESREKLTEVCAPTASTTNFAIRTSTGKVYKVDGASNTMLANDVQRGALKADKDGDIHAVITGHRRAGLVSVNSVVEQK